MDLRAAFADIDLWIFDLDNTLYARPPGLWEQVDARMSAFIAEALEVDRIEARRVQKDYLHRYGLTVRGLMLHHGIAPHEFLGFVHDVDLSDIPENPRLSDALDALPGRKVIHTNSDRAHTDRVLNRLGLREDAFDAIYDIEATGFEPKPGAAAFDSVLTAERGEPTRAAMFEDAARNLLEPHRRGMRTVWLPTDCDYASAGGEEAHVHFVAEDVTDFVERLVGELS